MVQDWLSPDTIICNTFYALDDHQYFWFDVEREDDYFSGYDSDDEGETELASYKYWCLCNFYSSEIRGDERLKAARWNQANNKVRVREDRWSVCIDLLGWLNREPKEWKVEWEEEKDKYLYLDEQKDEWPG